MMTDTALQFLLAASGGNDFTGAIIFFVIWAVIGVLSQVGKWQQKKRQQQMRVPPSAPPVPPRPTQEQRQNPARLPQMQRQQSHQLRHPAKRPPQPPKPPQQRRPLPPIRTQPLPPPPPEPASPITRMAGEIGSSTEKATTAPPVTRKEVRALLRPWSMRKQFLIMELLQPPLSTRDPRP